MLGTLSCSSVACHGSPAAESGKPRGREAYINWIEFDPHARTRELLSSDRYQAILQRLEQSGHERSAISQQCAKCHDPALVPGLETEAAGQGIGCESCHGNAEKWISRHYERGISKPELRSLGMIDTKNLPQRAAACAKCHVGSADQDMNHDMIAAGHPPLRFELAAYHDLIKFKHWNDGPERLAKKDYQVQLWAAGQAASASARLELLEARAAKLQPKNEKYVWTEFAEFSCFSCHQKIQPDAIVEPATRGLPVWSRWNMTFAGQLQDRLSQQRMKLVPAELIAVSQTARGEISRAPQRTWDRQQLVEHLVTTLSSPTTPTDWETRSQQYLALCAAVRAQHDELAKLEFLGNRSLTHTQDVAKVQQLTQQLNQLGESLRFERAPRGVPLEGVVLIDEPLQFRENRDQLGPALLKVAEQLQERMKR